VSWGSLYYTFALLMTPLETEFGFSRAQSSLAFSIALLIEGLCAYGVGRLIDRGYGRYVMLVGSIVAACALFLHSLMSLGFQIYLFWALIGIAFACTLYAPAFAILTQNYPQNYRRAITGLTFLGGLASSVFIPLSAWLIRDLGWRQALQILALLHFCLCVPIHWFVLRPSKSVANESSAADSIAAGPLALPVPLKQLIWTPTFFCLAGYIVLSSLVTSALPAHLIPMLRERDLPEATVLLIPASIGVLQVIGRVLLFWFEKHLDLHASNRMIVAMMPIGFILLAISGNTLALIFLFACVFGMANGLSTIVKGTAMATYVNQSQVASLNGVLGIPNAIFRSTGPVLVGAMWSQSTGYQLSLFVLVLLSSIAATLFAVASKRSLIARNPVV
jgi:MFS family permease